MSPICGLVGDVIKSKHGNLSVRHKTTADGGAENNLDASRIIAHCKQHGFVSEMGRRRKRNITNGQKSIRAKARIRVRTKGNGFLLDCLCSGLIKSESGRT